MTEQTFAGVRLAGPQDEEQIFDLLMMLYAENSMALLSPGKVRDTIKRATNERDGFIGVIPGPNGLQATVGLFLSQWWYTDEWHLEEFWNFVHPEYRRSTHAKKLIMWSKWIADSIKLPMLMGILTKKQLEAKMRLIQRQMPQAGALFLWHGNPLEGQYNQRRIGRV